MQIEWPLTTWPGEIAQEGDGRLINAMVEKMGDGVKWIRSPGVARYYTSPESGFRGMAFLAGALYVSYLNHLYFTTSPIGAQLSKVPDTSPNTVSGSGPVFFAANQKSPTPDLVAVAPLDGGAYVITQTTQTSYSTIDPDLPAAVVDVCFGGGYFFFAIGDGRCFASGLNATTINPVDFTTANSKPDGLLRVIYFQGSLYMCGPDSIEVWGQPINTTGFPFNLITAITRGLIGRLAITGYENGIDLGLAFVSSNFQVMRLNGYQPERISQPDLERLISRTTDKSTIELTSFAIGAHIFLKVKAPTFCWIYDFTTQTWHERASYLSVTSRLKQAVYANWTNAPTWIVGDEMSGDLGNIHGSIYDEFNTPLIWSVTSKPIEPFPYRAVVGPAYFNFVPGQGSNVPYQIAIGSASKANPCIVGTAGVHKLTAGMPISIAGVLGMININSVSLTAAAPITPTSFALADANGNPINSTSYPTYTSGGTVTRITIPTQQQFPKVEVRWSDDGGLNFRPPEIRNLGAQGQSTIIVKVFLTGSISAYGRVWNLRVSDPVFVSFQGGEMPRISKREAA